jgi:hypothetical protein
LRRISWIFVGEFLREFRELSQIETGKTPGNQGFWRSETGNGLQKAVLKHAHSKRYRAFWPSYDLAKRLVRRFTAALATPVMHDFRAIMGAF